MKKYLIIFTALVSILAIGLTALAFQPDEADNRRDKIMERVGDLKEELLISQLDLNEATAEKLVEINEKYLALMMENITKKKDTMKALEALYAAEEVNEKEIDALIDDLFDIEDDITALRKKENKELSSLLSTEEFGRYLIFNERFHREIRMVIMEKSHGYPGEMGPEGMPPEGGLEFEPGECPEGPPPFGPPFGEPPM
ncbi:MAG: hypothetical protein JW885_06695 [Deltaproteobacteria bacterium]|nr:hypothetical protein [Candidatus Zymogenaceae bacterium]